MCAEKCGKMAHMGNAYAAHKSPCMRRTYAASHPDAHDRRWCGLKLDPNDGRYVRAECAACHWTHTKTLIYDISLVHTDHQYSLLSNQTSS